MEIAQTKEWKTDTGTESTSTTNEYECTTDQQLTNSISGSAICLPPMADQNLQSANCSEAVHTSLAKRRSLVDK